MHSLLCIRQEWSLGRKFYVDRVDHGHTPWRGMQLAKKAARQDGFQRGIGDMIFGKEGLLHAIIGVLLALLILGFLYRMGID